MTTSLASAQDASLLGDTVFIRREIPSLNFLTGPFPSTVVAGPSDTVSVSLGNNLYVDVESSSVIFRFGPEHGSGGRIEDHRIVVSDIDWFGQPDMIIGSVSATSDLPAFQLGLVAFDAHSLSLWIGTLAYTGGQYVDVQLTPTLVPEPSALGLLLIGAGAVLLLAARKGLLTKLVQ
jgi:hypothetical protein